MYTVPPTYHYTPCMEENLCRGSCIHHCFVRPYASLPCFLTFCRSGIPTSCYIFITCNSSFQVPHKNLGSRACTNSGYQTLFSPIIERLGTRLLSGLGMRSGYSWCPWSCCHHTIPNCCSSSLQEWFMSLVKDLFPSIAQDGGTVAFDLESKFANL